MLVWVEWECFLTSRLGPGTSVLVFQACFDSWLCGACCAAASGLLPSAVDMIDCLFYVCIAHRRRRPVKFYWSCPVLRLLATVHLGGGTSAGVFPLFLPPPCSWRPGKSSRNRVEKPCRCRCPRLSRRSYVPRPPPHTQPPPLPPRPQPITLAQRMRMRMGGANQQQAHLGRGGPEGWKKL